MLRTALPAALLLLASCGPPPAECISRCDGGPSDDAGDPDAVVGLRIEPAEIELAPDGAPATQALTLYAVEADGDERAVEATGWLVADPSIASIDGAAVITASGRVAGATTASARLETPSGLQTANAPVHVRIARTFVVEGAPADVAARFDVTPAIDPAATPIVLYPLDGALMPRNLRPPVVQWRPTTGETDLFRVRVASEHVAITAYLAAGAGFEHGWAIDEDAWDRMIDADPDGEITITIDRFQAARDRVLASGSTHMRVARGSVFGEVYFWALDQGRIHAIDPETATPRVVVENPPPQGDGQRCMACHAVSRDGRWMFGRRFDDGAGWIVDLREDLSGDPPPMRYEPTPGIETAAFDPSGDYLLAASPDRRLFVVDARTGLETPSAGLPSAAASMPAWSAGGELVAWIAGGDPSEPSVATSLAIARRSGDGFAFGAPTTLHEGSTLASTAEGGSVDALPSFTPDDRLVVFQHGAAAFTTDDPTVRGALYAVSVEGGDPWRLDRASEGGAFWPSASPYVTTERDGRRVYWIAFHSRRDYGNALAGSWGTRNRQLWIAAVDADASPGEDPSSVPVWLPGQDTSFDHVAAFWAPETCRDPGAGCSDDNECCSGICNEDPETGEGVCAPPPG